MRSFSLAMLAIAAVNAQTPASTEFQLPKGIQLPKGFQIPKGFQLPKARGTGEPGPYGVVVGDMLVNAVAKAVPGARGYAVQYPANLRMDTSSPTGTDDAINRLNAQHAACPNQKFALVGYSQGAGVMHGIFAPTHPAYPGSSAVRPTLNPDVIPKILALVMFGDPGFRGGFGLGVIGGGNQFPGALFDRLRQNCAKGDPVCDPATPAGFERHLEYAKTMWQQPSADFIIAAFKGQQLPKSPRVPEDLGMVLKPSGAAPAPAKVPRRFVN